MFNRVLSPHASIDIRPSFDGLKAIESQEEIGELR
jgi:hypothetical protein